jgi:membrane-bound lytic murein transglycosylase B
MTSLTRRAAFTPLFRAAALTVALLAAVPASASEGTLAERPEVSDFISFMVKKYAFTPQELADTFNQVQIRDDILAAIARPAEAKPWSLYRPIFITDDRIRLGVDFWSGNQEQLEAAHREFGVAPQYLVGIVGVETRFGRQGGGYRVMDALTTLAFNYPPRSPFFRSELENFLVMTREEKIAPLSLKGSYAGAMGQPQFMPSSFRNFAIDFDGDGHRDLWSNTADVLGSVANYFHAHGWRADAPVVHRARVSGDQYEALVTKVMETNLTFAELAAKGVSVDEPIPAGEKVALLRLEGAQGPEYWVARHNFFVITRYNRSPLYAMAVHQLGEAVRNARDPSLIPVSTTPEKPKTEFQWCPACE